MEDGYLSNLSEKARHDYLLVRLGRNGNQKAFAELMERYREAIYYMLLRMVANRDDAEDLTIEAFGKAFKCIDQYEPRYAFSTWLFKIATNNCIDFIRNKKKTLISIDKKYETCEGIETSMELESQTGDPEIQMMKDQKMDLLQQAIKQMEPRFHNVLELRYFKEYTYEEIAAELNIPMGTVKAQLHRARGLLQEILKNMEGRI